MAKGKVEISAEYIRAWRFGSLDAEVIGAEWDEEKRRVILTIQGNDVPLIEGLLRVETVTSTSQTSRFVPSNG